MRRRIMVAATAAILCGGFASTAAAHHSWGSYHWGRTTNPFTLKVVDTTSSGWTSYVSTAIGDWNASGPLVLNKLTGTSNRHCAAIAGQAKVCNSTYGNNGWLGLATIWTASGTTHIAQATTKLNDTYFNSGTYNTPAWRSMVACQEIGHDFGLDHQDENFNNANLGTCMDYTNNPSTNQHPNQGDLDQLTCIYDPASAGRTLSTTTHSCTGTGHLDSSNTGTKAPTGIVQRPGSENVSVTHRGGLTKITYVTYANPIH
jgi:hypothetical protein